MSKIQLIEAYGNNYEIGLQIGSSLKNEIKKTIKNPFKEKTIDLEDIKDKSKEYLYYANKFFPAIIKELKGIADGSNQKFEDLFLLNTEEVWDLPPEKCTSIVYKTKEGIKLYHNEDFEPEFKNVAVAKCKLKNVSFLSIILPGLLTGSSVSLNSYGLVQAINSIYYESHKTGIPRNFISSAIVRSKNIQEVMKIMKLKERASSYNHIIIHNNKFYNIEATPYEYKQIEIKSDAYAHTNHYTLKKFAEKSILSKGSINRLKYANSIIKKKEINEKAILSILSSHKKDALICKHDVKNDDITLASVIADPNNLKLSIAKGNPCKNKYYEFSL